MIDGTDLKRKFHKQIGFFGQKYLSLRTPGFEVTLDNLTPKDTYLVCLCTPYNERLDQRKHRMGVGGGEVKESWEFESEEEALHFISCRHLI